MPELLIDESFENKNEKRREEIAKKFVENIKNNEKFLALLLTLYKDEFNKKQLMEKLNINNDKELIKHLNFLTKEDLVKFKLKRKSKKQKYYKLTPRTKNIFNDIFGINNSNIDNWINSFNHGKLKKKLESIMFL